MRYLDNLINLLHEFITFNFDLLDSVLTQYYDWDDSGEYNEIFENHILVQAEIEKYINDLNLLDDNNTKVSQIYRKYHLNQKESILQEFWFNKNFQ